MRSCSARAFNTSKLERGLEKRHLATPQRRPTHHLRFFPPSQRQPKPDQRWPSPQRIPEVIARYPLRLVEEMDITARTAPTFTVIDLAFTEVLQPIWNEIDEAVLVHASLALQVQQLVLPPQAGQSEEQVLHPRTQCRELRKVQILPPAAIRTRLIAYPRTVRSWHRLRPSSPAIPSPAANRILRALGNGFSFFPTAVLEHLATPTTATSIRDGLACVTLGDCRYSLV